MKHRERVLMALSHEEPDRCPLSITFTPEFVTRLRNDMGLADEEFYNPHGGGNTYVLERTIGADMLLTSVGWANSYYATDVYSKDGVSYTDEWGIGWKNVEYETRFGKGRYTEIVGHPLADEEAIDLYQPPDPNRPELYLDAARMIKEYKGEYWIVGATVCTIFEAAWALRGLERALMDLIVNPDFVEKLFDIPFNYHLTAAKKLVEMGVDMIWIGDDVGGQSGMLISPQIWRQFLKPRLAKFISMLKSVNPEVKIAYHSDGTIYPILSDLIEIGLDILNPVQPKCMDPEKLKKEYGDKLCFWGSIDEQYTLPFGTAAEVKKEVITRLKTLGKNGGLIIGPTHHVQLDTPLENFWAMVNTVKNTSYSTL